MIVPMTEALFQDQVEQLATLNGWQYLHIERMGNEQGRWRTPVSGNLGKGWPDLFLVRGSQAIFVELKSDRGVLTESQRIVRLMLEQVHPYYIWRPRDWNQVLEVLAR